MGPKLSPSEKSLVFAFEGTEGLYRDHDGKRVLTDVEGAGHFRVLTGGENLCVLVDDKPFERFEGSYDHSLAITSSNNECFKVAVGQRRSDLPLGPVETGEEFEGCGWIVDAKEILSIDGDHGKWNGMPTEYSVPFFRSARGENLRVVRSTSRCEEVDAFDMADGDALKRHGWSVQNTSLLFDLDSCFPDGTPFAGSALSHLNAANFRLHLPPNCSGLVLRKRYDQFHGRQRARVLVDGKFAGWWYEPGQDRVNRWTWSRFGTEEPYVAGKTEITVSIDPPAGSPLWSVSRYEIWAMIG